jgi:hypothetical protein
MPCNALGVCLKMWFVAPWDGNVDGANDGQPMNGMAVSMSFPNKIFRQPLAMVKLRCICIWFMFMPPLHVKMGCRITPCSWVGFAKIYMGGFSNHLWSQRYHLGPHETIDIWRFAESWGYPFFWSSSEKDWNVFFSFCSSAGDWRLESSIRKTIPLDPYPQWPMTMETPMTMIGGIVQIAPWIRWINSPKNLMAISKSICCQLQLGVQ